jgi:hypothetical protein
LAAVEGLVSHHVGSMGLVVRRTKQKRPDDKALCDYAE